MYLLFFIFLSVRSLKTLDQRKAKTMNNPRWTSLSIPGGLGTSGIDEPGVSNPISKRIVQASASMSLLFTYCPNSSPYSSEVSKSDGNSPSTFTLIIQPSP